MVVDNELYKELLTFCDKIKEQQRFRFESNIMFSNLNEKCYTEMFLNRKTPTRPLVFKDGPITELKTLCSECARFHMTRRNEMIKGFDIQHGHWFEDAFRDFLRSKNIETKKRGFPFPDIEVIKNNNPVAYFELKYIRSPFIYANSKVDNSRWCYECSLTLDIGEKLTKQRNKIEDELLSANIPVFYVWWFDAPCIKGIFFMTAEEVFDFWDSVGTSHERKERLGDAEAKQERGKIYPPLLEMKGLDKFIKTISKS
ncbi:MAG: hypothetical protein ABIJ92_04900 [Candidatus Aenigmatarchaeota archaeon]